MEEKLEKVKTILEKNGQTHLLSAFDKLDDNKKEILLNQILGIDFDLMENLYENTKKEIELGDVKIEPISYKDKYKMPKDELEKYKEIGEEEIKNGKLAELSYQRINEVNGNSLVDVSLKTGRHNQIRVQFAYAGYPLVGDSLYGNDKNKKLMLHSYLIGFYHPTTKEWLEFRLIPSNDEWKLYFKGSTLQNN
mgnify:CR=1 FL=1